MSAQKLTITHYRDSTVAIILALMNNLAGKITLIMLQ